MSRSSSRSSTAAAAAAAAASATSRHGGTMQALCAVVVEASGGDTAAAATAPPLPLLQWREVAVPAVTHPHDVLVRVAYADLNPVDLQKLRPNHNNNNSNTTTAATNGDTVILTGYSGSGVVVAVGSRGSSGSSSQGGDDKDDGGGGDNDDTDEPHDHGRRRNSIAVGDRVAFLTPRGGSYAEYVVVDARAVAVLPDAGTAPSSSSSNSGSCSSGRCLSLREAAVVPLAGCTAYQSLVKLDLGRPGGSSNNSSNNTPPPAERRRRRLLIVGGGGGVGSWATVLVKAWWGDAVEVICTATITATPVDANATNADATADAPTDPPQPQQEPQPPHWCLALGADRVIGHGDIATALLPGGVRGGVDAILCLTEPTPALWKDLVEVIAPFGKLCLVVAGPSIASLDLGFVFFKSASVATETVFSSFRAGFAAAGPQPRDEMADIFRDLQSGAIRAPLAAHPNNGGDWKRHHALEGGGGGGVVHALATGHTRGKLCMKIAPEDE